MTKEKMLEELSTISSMIAERPWWQKNLLDECSKATSTTPRPTESATIIRRDVSDLETPNPAKPGKASND